MPPRRKQGARRGRPRKMVPRSPLSYRRFQANIQPVFTEMWNAGTINVNSSGVVGDVLTLAGNSIPQMPQYSKLYRQFRILKATWILVPRFTSVDINSALYNGSVPISTSAQGRLVYAVNDSAGVVPPTSEIQLLQDNGAKLKMCMRSAPIKITHKPVPVLNIAQQIALNSAYENKRNTWLNTDNTTVQGSGTAISWQGVSYYLTVPTTVAFTFFDVYCKTTVQFKDPA